ncbi:basic secretory protein-like protein [Sinomicrobium sp. M5D2P17]
MKNVFVFSVLTLLTLQLSAQSSETFRKKGKTLVFVNEDPGLVPKVKEDLVNTFFKVYPKLVKRFNHKSPKRVEVKIDTAYTGVAYAHDGKITISAAWLRKKPKDTDVITHEVMHLVQSYPSGSGPGWITEGIADYVRYKYGVDNEGSGWSLPDYAEGQHYSHSYRITARFLLWLSEIYQEDLILQLDQQMRNATYSGNFWKKHTDHSLDMLWEVYILNPKLS